MGATTLAEMVNTVFAKIDEDTASVQAVTSKSRPEIVRVVDDLNDAYAEVWKHLYGTLAPQSFDMITTQAGVPTYQLPYTLTTLGVKLVGRLDGSAYVPMAQSNIEELTRINGNLNQQGTPLYWYRYNNVIGFYPCPNIAMNIRVVGSLEYAKLRAGTDTSVLPEIHDRLLTHYAIGAAKAFWKDPDAGFWMDKFTAGINHLKAAALRAGPRRQWRTNVGDGTIYPIDNWLTQNTEPGP